MIKYLFYILLALLVILKNFLKLWIKFLEISVSIIDDRSSSYVWLWLKYLLWLFYRWRVFRSVYTISKIKSLPPRFFIYDLSQVENTFVDRNISCGINRIISSVMIDNYLRKQSDFALL